jgi:hypothetical protein
MGDDLLFPLVDEPIGAVVDRIQSEEAAIAALVASPRRQLAFRTFAYVRVGILLGRILVERDLEPRGEEEGTWVDQLLAEPDVAEAVRAEVRAVADEVASDPSLAEAEPVGPDEAARERFREFARRLGR